MGDVASYPQHQIGVAMMNIDKLTDNQLVAYYLMSSYLYYQCDKQVLTDDQFDTIAKKLLDRWDSIRHMHKHLITKDDLTAGTGYAIQYTTMIKNAATRWHKQEVMT